MDPYIEELIACIEEDVARKRALGWTQRDFANALKELLEEEERDTIQTLRGGRDA